MKNINKASKIFAYFALTSGAIWLGAYITRLTVTYQLFQEEELVLREYLNESNLPGIFETIKPTIFLSLFPYLLLIVSFTLFLFTSKINLKKNGWLFIITIIIYVMMPFEIYLMLIDYKLIIELMSNLPDTDLVIKLTIDRFENLSSFPLIEILSYLSIPFLLIFKPLSKQN